MKPSYSSLCSIIIRFLLLHKYLWREKKRLLLGCCTTNKQLSKWRVYQMEAVSCLLQCVAFIDQNERLKKWLRLATERLKCWTWACFVKFVTFHAHVCCSNWKHTNISTPSGNPKLKVKSWKTIFFKSQEFYMWLILGEKKEKKNYCVNGRHMVGREEVF